MRGILLSDRALQLIPIFNLPNHADIIDSQRGDVLAALIASTQALYGRQAEDLCLRADRSYLKKFSNVCQVFAARFRGRGPNFSGDTNAT